MKTLVPIVVATLALFATWVAWTQSLDPQELAAGAVLSLLVAILAGGMPFRAETLGILHPKRFLYALAYLPYLFKEIVKANLDVARRVVAPALPIRPGIVRVKTKLRNPIGRLVLANSITLTPGTLTVDIRGDELFIHWIDVRAKDVQAATEEIVAGFEKYLEVIFG